MKFGIGEIEIDMLAVREQPWPSGLGTCLSTRGSCVRIPLRSRLDGSQSHPPPQGGNRPAAAK